MIFTKRQLQQAIERHTQATGMTLLELSDRTKTSVETLSQLLQGQESGTDPKERSRLGHYFFGEGKQWPHWQTENHQAVQTFCRAAQDHTGTSLLTGAKHLGKTTALLDYAFFRPNTLYLDLAKPEDRALLPTNPQELPTRLQLPNGQETTGMDTTKKKLLVLDHAETLPDKICLGFIEQKQIPLVLCKGQAGIGTDTGNKDPEVPMLALSPLSKKTVRSIASFYGVDHEGDVDWLHKKAKNFVQLRKRIQELQQVLVEPGGFCPSEKEPNVLFSVNCPQNIRF